MQSINNKMSCNFNSQLASLNKKASTYTLMYLGITVLSYQNTLKLPDCMVKQELQHEGLWIQNKEETVKASHNTWHLFYNLILRIPNTACL
jgi:hypothetical protein